MAVGGVRITGGVHRGRRLEVPGSARPSGGRLREALLSIWGPRLEGSRFLDLFAGSGAVGFEAASRGAAAVLAIEADVRALRLLEHNRKGLGEERLVIRRLTLPEGLRRLGAEEAGPFDLVFADPPYAFSAYEPLLAGIELLLADGGEVALEHSGRRPPPRSCGGLERGESRRYGDSGLSLYRRTPRSPADEGFE
ncbi:MAG: 16S rRNA (guanine(966)-N(2))-methyltransferase RsmD [Acidobacteria bacterium]|nr:16S rRNA (guanine(966)-N(2))-methyltransferase RsmD [Acidobacteriota bacterium]